MSFKSLVIIDLETSGLPCSGSKTKITELSVVGVLVDHVIESNRKGEKSPRVLQKLSVCFYPQKVIDFEATRMTGLDNFLLETIPTFNHQAVLMLSSFLKRMPQPLCLVAHNGLKFDFQLLRAELAAKNEVLLPQEISCVDSLLAFQSLFPVTTDMCTSPSPVVAPLVRCDSTVTPIKVVTERFVDLKATVSNELPTMSDLQTKLETTPKHSRASSSPVPLKRKLCHENDDRRNNIIRKRLFPGYFKPDSHKLIDLYRYICGKEQVNVHQAECESIALLECIVVTAPEFLRWIENNHVNFSTIPCMW